VTFGDVQRRQLGKADGDIRVLGAERLLPDRQGALVERFGLTVATLGLVQRR
jgi:hypothetical protein